MKGGCIRLEKQFLFRFLFYIQDAFPDVDDECGTIMIMVMMTMIMKTTKMMMTMITMIC